MNKRTKACAISPKVREAVERRDGGLCIFCGHPGRGEAHYINRAHGGLGIEQNIITVCRPCHDMLDNSTNRPFLLKIAEAHLSKHYENWSKENLVYNKWRKEQV